MCCIDHPSVYTCKHLFFRTERNVHLFLVDVDSGEECHVSGLMSDRITSFLKSAFHQNIIVNIGGIRNENANTEVGHSVNKSTPQLHNIIESEDLQFIVLFLHDIIRYISKTKSL